LSKAYNVVIPAIGGYTKRIANQASQTLTFKTYTDTGAGLAVPANTNASLYVDQNPNAVAA